MASSSPQGGIWRSKRRIRKRRGSGLTDLAEFISTPSNDGSSLDLNIQSMNAARFAHCATLMGYGLILSIATVPIIVGLAGLTWTKERDGDGIPRLENRAVFFGISFPILLEQWLLTILNIFQNKNAPSNSGPAFAWVPFGVGIVLIPIFVGIHFQVLAADLDAKYIGLDLILGLVYCCIFILCDITVRTKYEEFLGRKSGGARLQQTAAVDTSTKTEGFTFKWNALVSFVPLIALCVIIFAYPFGIIPLFLSSGTLTRLVICLVIHPVVLEAAEVFSRSSSAHGVALELSQGLYTIETAEVQIVELSHLTFAIKQLMAFYRRMMLLNMLDPFYTLVAIVLASLEEVGSRGFLVHIDAFFRWLSGKPKLEGNELKLQRIVWMCDTNLSCIAEFNAIFTSSIAHVLLQSHAVVIAIGYEPSVAVNAASVLVQLLVELALEMFTDVTTMRVFCRSHAARCFLTRVAASRRWAEAEHSIPVTQFFVRISSPAALGFHVVAGFIGFTLALYSFIRHPHFLMCDSSDACMCIEQPMFEPWLRDRCNVSSSTNTSQSPLSVDDGRDMFSDVDFFSVIVALLGGISMIAIIILAVLIARYRRRQAKVVDLENAVKSARKSALSANLALRKSKKFNFQLKQALRRAEKTVNEVTKDYDSFLQPYKIRHGDLTFEHEVGKGSFGVVWKGTFRDDSVAIKTVRMTRVTNAVVKALMDEIKIIAPLNHPYCITLQGGCWTDGPDKLCIVLEFCERGSLKNLLLDEAAAHSWEQPYYSISHGVALCFRYLHHEQPSGNPLIHRDLKPDNVLICQDWSPRVADFGEARRTQRDDTISSESYDDEDIGSFLMMTAVGTPMYAAPEVQQAQPKYNKSVDTYS